MTSLWSRILAVFFFLALLSSCAGGKQGAPLGPAELPSPTGPAGLGLPGGGGASGAPGGSPGGTNGAAPPAPTVNPAPDFDPKGFFAKIHQATGVQCVDPTTMKAHLHIKGQVQKFDPNSVNPVGCCTEQVLRAVDDDGRYLDVQLKTIGGKEGVFDFDFYPGYTLVNGHKTINVQLYLADVGFISPLLDVEQMCCSFCDPNVTTCSNGFDICGGNANWLVLMESWLQFTVDANLTVCNPPLAGDATCQPI